MANRRGDTSASPQQTNPFTVLLRIAWMVGGPAVAGLLILIMVANEEASVWRDVAIGIAVSIAVAARYLDIAFFRGETADGEPATMQHFWRYAVKLLVAVGVAWALVRGWRMT